LLSLWATPALAEHRAFRTFTGTEGLSQLTVLSMARDARGYLWIGTEGGVDRFDGRRFQNFGPKEGLSKPGVSALAAAPDDALWIGTSVGLDRYHEGRIESFGRARGLRESQVNDIETTPDGRVWCATGAGLAVLEGDRFRYLPAFEGTPLRRLALAPGGALWIGAASGIWRQDATGLERVEIPAQTAPITALTVGPSGRVFAGAKGTVDVFEGGRWLRRVEVGGANRPTVYALKVDRLGVLWVADELGLLRHHAGESRRFGPADHLRITNMTSIVEDIDGFLWVGGFGGIGRFVGRAFTIYDDTDGLPSANTRPILRTRSGDLWVGTANGIARWDGGHFTPFGAEHGLTGSYVLSLYEDRRGRIWVGTQRGLFIQGEGEVWARRPLTGGNDGAVGSIAEDSKGRVWIALDEVGVFRVEGEALTAVPVPGNTFGGTRLLVGTDDRVWVSGAQGLSMWNDGAWKTYRAVDGLAHKEPYHLAEGPRGGIWFGYYAPVGFSRFDGQSFQTWSTADGLAHASVYSLGFDSSGALWLGTARGVDRFRDGDFLNYGPAEGYPSTESNSAGFLAEDDGRVWFGTAEGLAHYEPRLDTRPSGPVRLRWGEVTVGAVRLDRDGLKLSAGNARLSAALELISFEDARHVSMRARLVGLSSDWITLRRPLWEVPNLAPGRYRLEVQARRHGGGWATALSRSFIVSPPWWRTLWATLGAGLCFALLVFGAARLRLIALARQNQRLHSMVARRTARLQVKTTDLELAQEGLRRTNEELREANRVKSQFVANVSHEIRTPMNGILGMTELALAEPLTPQVREYLETVEASGLALLELINDILDLSRVESGRLELDPAPMSLRQLLEGILRAHQFAAMSRGLELSIVVDDRVPDAWRADAGRLRQVLINLVGNALKFTSEGFVRVRVERTAANLLRFDVEDSGVGIAPEHRETVFDLFTQVDGSTTRERGGTGLGLNICREIVQLMGGQIDLESELGAGSTFSFTARLEPAPDVVIPKPTSSAETRPPTPPNALRVLVAEDNPVNQLVVRRMLERLGHSVVLVDDGEQAVEAAAKVRYDVALMDVQMPRCDGIEAARRIRASEPGDRPRLPIIALTAHAMRGDRERTLEAGMDAYLTKPVSSSALEEALAELTSGSASP